MSREKDLTDLCDQDIMAVSRTAADLAPHSPDEEVHQCPKKKKRRY
jgi:hypothetical protein